MNGNTFPATSPQSTKSTFCARRMEHVPNDEFCLACFTNNPQLRYAYNNRRMQCVQSNILHIEPPEPQQADDAYDAFLECLQETALQMRLEGATDSEIVAFGRGLLLMAENWQE